MGVVVTAMVATLPFLTVQMHSPDGATTTIEYMVPSAHLASSVVFAGLVVVTNRQKYI